MTHRALPILAVCLAALLASGCVSWLSVEKVANQTTDALAAGAPGKINTSTRRVGKRNPSGIRYYLPQVFIMVTPKPDGGVDVEPVYFANPDEQYAISAGTVLGTHTLDVTLEDGLLKELKFNADTSAVATALVNSAGNLAEAKLNAKAEADKTAAEKESKAQEDRLKKIEEATQARRKAETDLAIARAKVSALEKESTIAVNDPKLVEARIDAAVKEAALNEAKEDEKIAESGQFLDPANKDGGAKDGLTAPSPVLFAVLPSKNGPGVDLKAVKYSVKGGENGQFSALTYKIPPPAPPAAAKPTFNWEDGNKAVLKGGRITLLLKSSVDLVEKDKSGNKIFEVESLLNKVTNEKLDLNMYPVSLNLKFDKRTVVIDFDRETPKGIYTMKFVLVTGKAPKLKEIDLSEQVDIVRD